MVSSLFSMTNDKPRLSHSIGKLSLVGIIFYATYGFANWFTAQRSGVPEIVFAWEQHIPFWAWSIVPYWSLNILYAWAFFMCHTVQQQHRYMAQLLLAQGIAIMGFLCFPLQFSWVKPPTDGLTGSLFASLAAFDQPYNQAPSLHIMLVLIVGRFYWYRISQAWRMVWLLWLCLIALSVLTTWQHHFIDIPTGILAGAIVLWCLPNQGNDVAPHIGQMIRASAPLVFTRNQWLWVALYATLAAVCVGLAGLGGGWLWCLWGAVAWLMMSLAYARWGANILGKTQQARLLGASILLLPHTIVSYVNAYGWLYRQPRSAHVSQHVYIGSILASRDFAVVLDVCAELPVYPRPPVYHSYPMLDMVAPPPQTLAHAAQQLAMLQQCHSQPILVCCALGYGRSAAVLLTWLLHYGDFVDIEHAIAHLQQARPQIVVSDNTRLAIQQAIHILQQSCHTPSKEAHPS